MVARQILSDAGAPEVHQALGSLCHLESADRPGGSTSLRPAGNEYDDLPKLPTGSKLNSRLPVLIDAIFPV
jgi:hypothetical protein